MGDLAINVVQHVRLRDTVSCTGSNPTHKAAEVSKQSAVQGGKRATGEGECASTVVREEGVSMLEEGDKNQPVVNPISD